MWGSRAITNLGWGDVPLNTDPSVASSDPCHPNTFHGRSPFSEPETKAIRDYATRLFPADQRKENPQKSVNVPLGEGDILVLLF